jgi:hypothetical protein
MRSRSKAIGLLASLAVFAACGDGTGPASGSVNVTVRTGDAQFGTSGATLSEQLQVIVTDPSSKKVKSGVQVQWRIAEGSGAALTPTSSTTNAQGIAATTLRLGEQLGTYRVEATTEKIAGSPASFTAKAVAVPTITSVEPSSADAGGTVTIIGQNFSSIAEENVVSFGGFRGQVASASATQLSVTIPTCVPSRTVAVRAALGVVAGNSVSINVTGTTATPLQLTRGETRVISEPAELACFQLPGAVNDLRFLLVPQNFSEVVGSLTGVELAGLIPGSTSVFMLDKPFVLPAAEDLEWQLRRRERDLLRGPGAALRPQGSVTAAACPAPVVGGRCNFQVLSRDNSFKTVVAEVKAISTRAIIYQDITAPTGNVLTTADFQGLGTVFDDPIYQTDVSTFGAPSDLDENDKIIILLTPVVNAWTERGATGFIAGFFYGCDLLSRNSCNGSNEAEIFYVLTADPNAQFSDARSRDAVMRSLPPVLAHEFQHMINFGQRGNSVDALWLAEGMAHHAEDVVGDVFATRGDAVNADLFKRQNTTRADRYLRATSSTSLLGDDEVGSLELRGGAWLFVKYLSGQYGNALLASLTRSTSSGVANVTSQTGKPWRDLLSDWSVALWADDAPDLAGVTLRTELTFPDMNIRQRIPSYPLTPTLFNGFQDFIQRETLVASSQSYVLIRGGTAPLPLNLTFAGKYGGPFATSAAPQLTVLRAN